MVMWKVEEQSECPEYIAANNAVNRMLREGRQYFVIHDQQCWVDEVQAGDVQTRDGHRLRWLSIDQVRFSLWLKLCGLECQFLSKCIRDETGVGSGINQKRRTYVPVKLHLYEWHTVGYCGIIGGIRKGIVTEKGFVVTVCVAVVDWASTGAEPKATNVSRQKIGQRFL